MILVTTAMVAGGAAFGYVHWRDLSSSESSIEGDDASPTAPDSYDAASVTPSEVDPCGLVTSQQVTQAMGERYEPGTPGTASTGGGPACTFNDYTNGGFINILIGGTRYGSISDWSQIVVAGLAGQGQPASGPWTAGESACFANGCTVEFLAAGLDVTVSGQAGDPNLFSNAYHSGVQEIAVDIARNLANASGAPSNPSAASDSNPGAGSVPLSTCGHDYGYSCGHRRSPKPYYGVTH